MSALNLRQLSDNLLRSFFVILHSSSNLRLHHPFKILHICRIKLRSQHVVIKCLHIGYLYLETSDHFRQLFYHHAYLPHLFISRSLNLIDLDSDLSLQLCDDCLNFFFELLDLPGYRFHHCIDIRVHLLSEPLRDRKCLLD